MPSVTPGAISKHIPTLKTPIKINKKPIKINTTNDIALLHFIFIHL
jgi:hypothetical protein